MKTIGIAGPVELKKIDFDFGSQQPPDTYPSPLIASLANELLNKGYKVILYAISQTIDTPTLVLKDERLTICVAKAKKHPSQDILLYTSRKNLLKLMKEYPADIIHAHWQYEFAWAAIDSKIPTLVTYRDHAPTILKYDRSFYRLQRLIMNNIVLGKTKYAATNSEYLKELTKFKEGTKVKVLSNFFNSALAKVDLVKEKGDYIITVAHGFSERKNMANGIRAFAEVRKIHPNLKYKLIGEDMEEGGEAYHFAKENGLLENIEFVGSVDFDTVIENISRAKLLLHPALEESFGNTIIEAMVLGTKVIGGEKSGNIPFIISSKKYGSLCNVLLVDSIKHAILSVLKDIHTDKYYEEIIATRDYAMLKYSYESIIAETISYYEEMYETEKKLAING